MLFKRGWGKFIRKAFQSPRKNHIVNLNKSSSNWKINARLEFLANPQDTCSSVSHNMTSILFRQIILKNAVEPKKTQLNIDDRCKVLIHSGFIRKGHIPSRCKVLIHSGFIRKGHIPSRCKGLF